MDMLSSDLPEVPQLAQGALDLSAGFGYALLQVFRDFLDVFLPQPPLESLVTLWLLLLGAFEGVGPALRGFEEYADAKTGVYAVLRAAEQLPAFLACFNALEREPFFALAESGVDQQALARILADVEDPRVRSQVGALLSPELWDQPRGEVRIAAPAWGPGVPPWTSRIARGQRPNTR